MTTTTKQANILIVEDNTINYKLLEKRIKEYGHNPIGPAVTGEAAINMALEYRPDLILMDINLQGEMDGIDAAITIKENIQTPIIYITAYSEDDVLQRAKPTMPHGYILKPFQDRELEITIEMALYAGKLEAEARKAETALVQSEEKYRHLFNHAPAGIYDIDFTTNRITDINEGACHLLGYSRDEILHMNPLDILCEESRILFIERLNEMMAGGSVSNSVEYEVVTKAGEKKWALLSIQFNSDGDNVIGASVVAHDISEIKETKKKLEESEMRFTQLFEHIGTGVAAYQAINDGNDFVFTAFNQAAEKITKISRKQAVGNRLLELFPNMEKSGLLASLRKVWETGKEEYMQPFYYRDNVREGWRENRIFKLPSGEVVALFDDVTERIKAELELKESKERYELAMQFANDGLFDWNLEDNTIYYSPGWKRLIGYEDHEMPNEFSEWERLTDPVDVKDAWAMLNDVMEGRRERFEIEFKMLHKKGHWVDILSRANIVRDQDGKGMRVVGTHVDITDRKRIESALRETEERFRIAFNTSPDAININRLKDGLYVDINDGFTKLTGFSREEAIGKTSSEIDIWHNADDRIKLVEGLQRNGYYNNLEAQFRRKDGSLTTALMSAKIIELNGEAHIISITRDISDRKMAEEKIRESEEKYRTTFESIPDILTISRVKDGRFSYVNDSFCEITGYSREEVLGQTSTDINLYVDLNERTKMLDELENNGRLINYQVKFRKKDGSIFYSLFSARLIEIDNEDCMIALIKDITKQKKLEEEKSLLEEQLKQAQKMEAIGTLAGGIAHDFNNLLQAISGYTQLLLMDKTENDQDYYNLKAIFNSSNRASELVRQLLLFSRKADSIRKPIKLNQEVENARRILERTIPKMIDIEVHTRGRLGTIMADPVQIEQILLNLGGNAADAIPESGRIVIETQNVTLDEDYLQSRFGARPGNYVLLSVSDTGQGIRQEIIEKIFEPFFTTKEFGKGTGLGLASVYGIVKSHGGYIMCYSEVGVGTTFRIYFPAVDEDDSDLSQNEAIAPPKGGTETILLVDDERPIREFASKALKRFGYTILVAASGEEALEIYTNSRQAIALVILDLGMPGMGGHKCVQELIDINPEIKILIASGYSINGLVQEALNAGAKGFVGKPYQINNLLENIRNILDDAI